MIFTVIDLDTSNAAKMHTGSTSINVARRDAINELCCTVSYQHHDGRENEAASLP